MTKFRMKRTRASRSQRMSLTCLELEARRLLAVTATYVGQSNSVDLVGVDAAVGSDSVRDLEITLNGLPPASALRTVRSIKLTGPSGFAWEYGANLAGSANAEFFRSANGLSGSLFINPTIRSNLDVNGVPLGSSTGGLITLANGAALAIKVEYAYDGQTPTDETVQVPPVVAGLASPPLSMTPTVTPANLLDEPLVALNVFAAQETAPVTRLGYVHIQLTNLPAKQFGELTISNQAGYSWSSLAPTTDYRYHKRIEVVRTGTGPTADLYFSPVRNESVNVTGVDPARNMILRYSYVGDNDGATQEPNQYVKHFAGGNWDSDAIFEPIPTTQYPGAITTESTLRSALLDPQYGVITLSSSAAISITDVQALQINHSVRIVGQGGGATLQVNATSWTPTSTPGVFYTTNAGIGNRRIRIELYNITIQFDAVASWFNRATNSTADVAVINLNANRAVHSLQLDSLVVKSPPSLQGTAPGPTNWVMNVDLLRTEGNDRGEIVNNYFYGGTVATAGGPWTITGNTHLGAVAAYTHSPGAFSSGGSRDLILRNNTVYQAASVPNGRIARLVNLEDSSFNALIEGNSFTGGIDGTEGQNNPEIIVTETNEVYYEGRVGAVSADGRVLRLLKPSAAVDYRGFTSPDDPTYAGWVVSILNERDAIGNPNPYAGKWYLAAQRIETTPPTYLMRDPMPPGDYVISVGAGFRHNRYLSNTIDMGTLGAGGMSARPTTGIVLEGAAFDAQVVGNTIKGGSHQSTWTSAAIAVNAVQTNKNPGGNEVVPFPIPTNWSRLPSFDVMVVGNTIRNVPNGIYVHTAQAKDVRSTYGRRLVTATIEENKFEYDQSFLDAWDDEFEGIIEGANGSFPGYVVNTTGDDSTPPTVTIGSGSRANGKTRVPLIVDPPRTFDFGTVQAPGTFGVNGTTYSAATGYGWVGTVPSPAVYSPAGATDFTRDVAQSTDMTFQVDLKAAWGWYPNGWYLVTLTLGDLGTTARQATVTLEPGTAQQKTGSASTAAGKLAYLTLPVRVNDASLIIRVQGTGGAASLAGLSIVRQEKHDNDTWRSPVYIDPTAIQVQLENNLAQTISSTGAIQAMANASGQVYAGVVNGIPMGMDPVSFQAPPTGTHPSPGWPVASDFTNRYAPYSLKNFDIAGAASTDTPKPLD